MPRPQQPQHRLLAPLLALLLASFLLVGLAPAGAGAASQRVGVAGEAMRGVPITLRYSGESVETYVAPPAVPDGPRLAAAQFAVTYDANFTLEMRAAFQTALDAWATQLSSPVTIRVSAAWASLPTGVLGQAGAGYFLRDFAGAPRGGTWYPAPLADKLAGYDLQPGQADYDVEVTFGLAFAQSGQLYYGTGATPAGKVNFISVTMHEVGHALGFSGSMTLTNGQGRWGGGSPYPFIYDRFTIDGAGQALLNTALYPNPSAALGTALRGNALRFGGAAASTAAGDGGPRLYAPAMWQQGSSYSHLDEATYPAGDANSLMTPSISAGESIYAPGPIALALLQDLGWEIAAPSPSPPTGSQAMLDLSIAGSGSIEGRPVGSSGHTVGTTVILWPQPGSRQTFVGWRVDGLFAGWASPLTLTMNASHAVQAQFAPTASFPDVGAGRGDRAAIVALASRGTIRGYQDGRYGPDDRVRRDQMAALIARAMPTVPGTAPSGGTLAPPNCVAAGTWDCEAWGNDFTDGGGVPAGLWRNAGALQHYGVSLGYAGQTCTSRGLASPCFGPGDPVTYAQTISFITRAMKAKGYWADQPGGSLPYTNVPPEHQGDVRTFHHYTGGVPAPPATWGTGATRGWFAQALWAALDSYWKVDRVP